MSRTPSLPALSTRRDLPPATLHLPIAGMRCAGCAAHVEKAIATVAGVRAVAVNLLAGSAAVELHITSAEQTARLVAAVERAGFLVPRTVTTLTLVGMHCGSCVSRVEEAVLRLPGVLGATVQLAEGTVAVEHLAGLDCGLLNRAMEAVGYAPLRPAPGEDEGVAARRRQREELSDLHRRLLVAAAATAVVTLASAAFMARTTATDHQGILSLLNWLARPMEVVARLLAPWLWQVPIEWLRWGVAAVAVPAWAWSAWPILATGAVRAVRYRAPDMNTLIALGTAAAMAASIAPTMAPGLFHRHGLTDHLYFETALMIVTLVLFGRLLEGRAKGRTSEAVRRLLWLAPASARKLENDGAEHDVDARSLAPGDRVRIPPGSRVPADGVVLQGTSAVHEAMLTGEPVPVAKGPGDRVVAGTLNVDGALLVLVERTGADTVLAHIVRLVRQAQASKAPVQRLADRVAAVFVPVVLVIAVATLLTWLWLGPSPRTAFALTAAMAVLVIACPCALGLATPTALAVGMGRGAELGILVTSATTLERVAGVRTVILDKTGTLTAGRPELADVTLLEGGAEALPFVAGVVARSEHPLARAVAEGLAARGVVPAPVTEVHAVPGRGVRSVFSGRPLLVGSPAFLSGEEVTGDELYRVAVDAVARRGATPVVAALEGRPVAVFALTDPLRDSAAPAVAELTRCGLEVWLVTGDSPATAAVVAQTVGIPLSQVRAHALPADKVAVVRQVQRATPGGVAFVGDGINDAPALAAADVGVSLASGTDVAAEAAQIVLARPNLRLLPAARQLARTTVRTIRWNLVWAFGYNVLGIPIAAGALYPVTGILLSPELAAAAMAFSSLFVVANSLRLRYFHPSG